MREDVSICHVLLWPKFAPVLLGEVLFSFDFAEVMGTWYAIMKHLYKLFFVLNIKKLC